jgi:hypothetical protein
VVEWLKSMGGWVLIPLIKVGVIEFIMVERSTQQYSIA